jgi:hypothetical protein
VVADASWLHGKCQFEDPFERADGAVEDQGNR